MRDGYDYIRYGNPTRATLEACLASLENAPEECPALCFSSGQSAIDAAMRLLRPGDHLLVAQDLYGGSVRLVKEFVEPMGVEVQFEDATDTETFCSALRPTTRMVWLESPSNPLLTIIDVPKITEQAHQNRSLVAIDSTFATPYFQNPLDWGVDIVMHSMTKYLGGHSDLLGGVLIVRDPALRAKLYEIQKVTGAVASPFDSWLTLRGVRTLAVRMRAHASNALAVATWLEQNSSVERVYYPGLPSHRHHARAKELMRGFGGMVGFEVKGGEAQARRVLQSTSLFCLAGSLGGVESIISYPPLMSHAAMSREEREARGIQDSFLRLSVGLEDVDDLLTDLEQALK
jgi:cystathionine beta-lyase/cystathionine gamma-synthase